MAINTFSVGKDVTLNIVTQLGIQNFSIRTAFKSEQIIKEVESFGLDGVPRFVNIPGGWRGSFRFDRTTAALDAYFAQTEALYFNGVPILPSSIVETIAEQNGNVSSFMFQAVVFKYDNAGEWRGDEITRQDLSFRASARIQLQ